MDIILVVNKPKGWTSHDVVNKVRRIYGVKKVGHAGTLDPMATGVLIVLVGDATKRQKEFMGMEKEYEAEITFGAETDTYDAEGIVAIERSSNQAVKNLTRDKIKRILGEFEGEIEQTVPPYSAVKVKGKRLYELARKGKIGNVKLPKRKVFIKEIRLLDFQQGNLPKARIRVVCSKGTYIRSLAHDLGQKFGCGAFLSELVRTRVGKFKLGSEEVMEVGDIKNYS